MKLYYIQIAIVLLFLSCSQTKYGELLVFLIDIKQDSSLTLSEIAEEITAVYLEITDESLINTGSIKRIIITENNIIVAETNRIFVFNKNGEFLYTIGSRGQGPGEYNNINNVVFDDQSQCLFIISRGPNKIICYQLDGSLKKESLLSRVGMYYDINYLHDELYLDFIYMWNDAKRILFKMNADLLVTDSIISWENYYRRNYAGLFYFSDFIIKNNSSVYFYPSEVYPKWNAPEVKVMRDTLFRIENNQLVPELKLKFMNDGFDRYGDKIIDISNIYRSSRYVFATYKINPNNRTNDHEITQRYFFCYDTKTEKGYNMLDGYTDDINRIEGRVFIRPLNTDSDIFYYWHTHMKPDEREEPNPTLYIGKLKK